MLSPQQLFDASSIIKEGLQQQPDFPLLMESSSFIGAPLVYDVNGDGIPDAVMADYDGGIYFIGLKVDKKHQRFFHKAQIPRLHIRKAWVESRLNETIPKEETNETETNTRMVDPYHSYFEYGSKEAKDDILRGVTANLMGQDTKDLKGLEERRQRKVNQDRIEEPKVLELTQQMNETHEHIEMNHRRLQEVTQEVVKDDAHEGANGAPSEHVNKEVKEALKENYLEDTNKTSQDAVKENAKENSVNETQKEIIKEGAQVVTRGVEEEGHHHIINEFKPEEVGQAINEAVEHFKADNPDFHDDIPIEDSENAEWEAARAGEGVGWGDDYSGDEHDRDLGDRDSEDGNSEAGDFHFVESYEAGEKEKGGEHELEKNEENIDIPKSYYDDYRIHGYDDYSGGRYGAYHEDIYDAKHYIRLPPHVLSTPVLAEVPKAYSNDKNEMEEMLFIAVSYYLDEDEYEGLFSYKRFEATDKGDETEVNRGMHVASALVVYNFEGTSARFGREQHLDLSGDATAPQNHTMVGQIPIRVDETKLGAFALGSPTIADIDGNGDDDVIIGTSMGMIYCFNARHFYNSDGWPIQVEHSVESRILVEDTMGNTNLEVYVNDVGGNIYCFSDKGEVLWRRNLLQSVTDGAELRGSSAMTMGDVDGDGKLDIVMAVKTLNPRGEWSTYIIAVSAITGDDLDAFPIEFDSPLPLDDGMGDALLHQTLPQPLLVDLHADQSHWKAYLYRNGTTWQHPKKENKKEMGTPHGGSASGLHIVQPVGSNLFIVEAGSGCIQSVAIGEEVVAMVQADDVHGTNNLDLVVSTTTGNIVTLESPVVPYHPLNVWNTGEVRSRRNNFAQGFTASQGIFVHDVSRRFRDVFGVYVPVTLEIFDNRPNIANEPDKRVYKVEIRDGTSPTRVIFRKTFDQAGVYTERVYIKYGPGFYTLSVILKTTNNIFYEDTFHLGYNVHFMDGFGLLLYLPLFLATIPILFCSRKKANWDDDDFGEDERDGKGLGILGRA